MASYHFTVKTDRKPDGTTVSASTHAEYIDREGKYKNIDQVKERRENGITDSKAHAEYINREAAFAARGGCVHKDNHLPKWANNSAKAFFDKADLYEAPSRTRYREIEFALPNELNLEQQKEMVNEFIEKHLGQDFYWALAIHDKEATMGDGERNPHVHIMFCERKLDEIEKTAERDPETFFKRATTKNPEKGGCPKDDRWNGPERHHHTMEMRKDCAILQNKILEKYGFDVTVDHRSLQAQREAAIERGDFLLAKLLDRDPEKSIGPNIAGQPNHEKVIELKQYRQQKKEYQQLIMAADILEKSIKKDESNESIDASISHAEKVVGQFESIENNVSELPKLTKSITETAKELDVVKKLIIWDGEAFVMARREKMTPDERKIEDQVKIISNEKLTLKRLEKQLIKPADWNTEGLKQYNQAKQQVANRLLILDQQTKELSVKLQAIYARFKTKDYKIKIAKEQRKILDENQPTKDMAAKLQHKLDAMVVQTRTIIHAKIEERMQHTDQQTNEISAVLAEKTGREPNTKEEEIGEHIAGINKSVAGADICLTAKQIKDILEPEIRSLKYELNGVENEIKSITHKVISPDRAEEVAKNNYTNGGFKQINDEKQSINKETERIEKAIDERQAAVYQFNLMEKPRWYDKKEAYNNMKTKIVEMDKSIEDRQAALVERTATLEKRLATLEAHCNTPSARNKIEQIIQGILAKNKPVKKQLDDLIRKRATLNKEISALTKQKDAAVKQIKRDISESTRSNKPEPQYKVRSVGGVGGGGGKGSNTDLTDTAKLIASAFNGDSKAVPLVVRINDQEEKDFGMMTQDQIEETMHKAARDRAE